MGGSITPVFVYSLPRSGSTLLQRMLSAHSQIASASEPWVLLPQLYAFREKGVYSEYHHKFCSQALNDFVSILPNQQADYRRRLREFVLALYSDAAHGKGRYFLDKTPRYHLIVNEIIEIFPDAKHIFLWRNPLSVIASMITTWGHGAWNVYKFKIDLRAGLSSLVDAFSHNNELVYSLRYEDLVNNGKSEISRLLDYLNLDYEDAVLNSLSNPILKGRMGDPTGVAMYDDLSDEGITKWMEVLNNPLRKYWCRKYLKSLRPGMLAEIGYDMEGLLNDIASARVSSRYIVSDSVYMSLGLVYGLVEPHIFKDKVRKLLNKESLYVSR